MVWGLVNSGSVLTDGGSSGGGRDRSWFCVGGGVWLLGGSNSAWWFEGCGSDGLFGGGELCG